MIIERTIIIIMATVIFGILLVALLNTNNVRLKPASSPPPKIEDRIRVYISSALFSMPDLFYAIGINGLTSTLPGGVTSDNIKFSKIDRLAQILSTTMGVPRGGIAQSLAQRGIDSYIPARDGFNMAVLIAGTQQYLPSLLTNPTYKDKLNSLGVVAEDANMAGAYLLMAVYSFDMYNLTSRCNCCIFNTNGLAMDDGSCVELGIASARGLPTVIHAPNDYTLFAGGIINPMVAGAASTDLSLNKWKFYNIKECIDQLEKELRKANSSSVPQYSHYAPLPEQVNFWNTLGERIWLTRYRSKDSHYVDEFGVLDQISSYTDLYLLNSGSPIGQGFIGSIICGIVKQTQKEFGYPPLQPIDTQA